VSIESLPITSDFVDRPVRPLLKWAGGKTQLLPQIAKAVPEQFNNYIEPFIGGGAVFFNLRPESAVISDTNAELISMYKAVATNPDTVARELGPMRSSETFFYEIRSLKFEDLSVEAAAARTIYLNRACFNGLYRVNRRGEFNVPFGKHTSLNLPDIHVLRRASSVLAKATIVHGDYLTVLGRHASEGDFVFLDPPYLPIGKYSDFKRYTREQFHEKDHRELAEEVRRLTGVGAHVVLTNSNHPLVHELYGDYRLEVLETRRSISSKGTARTGQDVIVIAAPSKRRKLSIVRSTMPSQVANFPPTRLMGSKQKLLTEIWNVASDFKFDAVVDLFSGSGVVSYMFKANGKRVVSNDYMAMAEQYAKALIANNRRTLSDSTIASLLNDKVKTDQFVERTFDGLYFTDDENRLIDRLRTNIAKLPHPTDRALAMAGLMRACTKKRARGIFTYVGLRYDDGRKDLKTPLDEHFANAMSVINSAVFDNGERNVARRGDALSLRPTQNALIYIDPPYFSRHSDNEYVRRYHFLEGLACNWDGLSIQEHTLTKKFKNYPTPFSTRDGAFSAFDALFRRYRQNLLLVSYSSNSLPTLDEIVELMARYKSKVEVIPVEHRYSFGNQGHKVNDNRNAVQEYLFIGY